MNVLVDAHMLGCRETGNETYVLNLIRQWRVVAARGFHIRALVRPSYTPEADWRSLAVPLAGASDIRRFLTGFSRAMQETQSVGLHVTYHAPFWLNLPYVVTLHDVSYRVHPQYHRVRNVVLQNVLGALSAWRARAVVTDSEFSRAEIERVYPFLKGRIFVMLGAADERLKPCEASECKDVLNRLSVRPPYVLWVGAFQARKNVYRLVQAFCAARAEHPNLQLVLVASPNTGVAARIRRDFASEISAGHIALLGYIEDRTVLSCLYSQCEAFAFPSHYEGFGLPVIEAMQCGAPVITSNVTALPEVAGDAALLVDPTDTDAIAHAIRRVLAEPELRATLRARGFKRAAQFSWAQTARLTAEAYCFAFGERAQ